MGAASKEEVFTEWVRNHRGIVVKISRGFTTNQADTDDLIQEILIRLWASMGNYRGESKPSTWIYRVALNRALTWQRDTKQRRKKEAPADDLHEQASAANADDRERVNRLYEQIRQLGDIDRALMLLSLDGLTYAEMSAITGLSESNVGARLSRARKTLFALINEDDQ